MLSITNPDIIFYYRLTTSIYKVESTASIDDFIVILYNGIGEFITVTQQSELKLPTDYIQQIKIHISLYRSRVPLYDVTGNHIFLIQEDNIYPRILYDHYRFIDKSFYADLVRIKNPTESDIENIRILSHYDLDLLQQTYLQIFYYSFVFNEYITSCRRPSFSSGLDHINPYYSITELYYMAVDWNLIKPAKLKKFKEMDLRALCTDISSHDIPGDILLSHQLHISKTKFIGLVKNYSLFGSYFINSYLRKYGCCSETLIGKSTMVKNSILENQILLMIKLIMSAPKFTKSHTVYRFIESDTYMQHLNPGDTYIDPSFMSTTRNPFAYQENYNFGYILIKITIPADIIGVGLCIESYSNFPIEEEIILPPTSVYELISITDNPEEHHHIADKKLSLNKIKKRYEFKLIGNSFIKKDFSDIKLNTIPVKFEPEIPNLDFNAMITDENIKFTPIASRLKHFSRYYINANSQFKSKISDNLDVTFTVHSYDSSSVYKPFFYYETPTGLMMYSFNPVHGNLNIMIELGPVIHINYYFKYSVTDTNHQLKISDPNWIRWLCLLSYIVGGKDVVIHSNFSISRKLNPDSDKINSRYTHSDDIYNYLTKKERMFGKFDDDIITPNFDYVQLDYLYSVNLFEDHILKETDHDELYKLATSSEIKTVAEFYIYIVDTYPSLLSILEDKINLFYDIRNINMHLPNSITYTLNTWTYLINQNLVPSRPKDNEFNMKLTSFKSLIGDKKIPKFKNRLRYYLENK